MLKIPKCPKEIFGNNIYINLAGKEDTRPWLCINKIPPHISLKEIEEDILKQKIETEVLHRKQNASLTSTIILFKVKNEKIEKTNFTCNNQHR